MAHDEENECQLGDIVKICEVRPVSRKKYWSLKQILNKIKN
jgi:small subunit ribosomal protein S17